MSWILLSLETAEAAVDAAELAALRTAAACAEQPEPLAGIVEGVLQEIRGHAAAGGWPLGPAGTLPARLEAAALSMIRYRVYARVSGRRPVGDARWHDNKDALLLLRQVARSRFQPDGPEGQDSGPQPAASDRQTWLDRSSRDGL